MDTEDPAKAGFSVSGSRERPCTAPAPDLATFCARRAALSPASGFTNPVAQPAGDATVIVDPVRGSSR